MDDRHAMYVGWVMGIAMSHAVGLAPVLDVDGNYTDRLELVLDDSPHSVTIVVPYPPDDWRP